jgi:hypothetical protein
MKKLISTAALVIVAQGAHALEFAQNFTGSFTDGLLAGYTVDAFIEIEDNGLLSGTADTSIITTGDGDLLDLGFDIFDTGDNFFSFFDLFDDLEPLASFESGTFVGLDYFGTNFDGDQLNVFYDAFAEDASSGITVVFEDFNGNISNGTLNLPTNVPEPSTYAAIFGLVALAFAACRRR